MLTKVRFFVILADVNAKSKRLEEFLIVKNDKFLRANDQIRISPLIVIDEDGKNLGTMSRDDAIAISREKNLDLVEINPTTRPPICKVMDFGKYKYEMAKKQKGSKAKQKEIELKEVRLTAKIGDHDIEYKAKKAKEFLEAGNKVKVSMRLRGRENIFANNAMDVFYKFSNAANVEFEKPPVRAGNQITAMIILKKETNN